MSTDSGIPDYRGPEGSLKTRKPVTYSEFLRSEDDRRHYWARSCLGWPFMVARRPNAAHVAVTTLQARGIVASVITQNVDGLHQAAGTTDVLELHGGLSRVVCLECSTPLSRDGFQSAMLERNPDWLRHGAQIAPDGDVELPWEATQRFVVPPCPVCGGTLKPDVVFFGENVPTDRVNEAFRRVDRADTLLVLGSSLTVYSGFRFADHAVKTWEDAGDRQSRCHTGRRPRFHQARRVTHAGPHQPGPAIERPTARERRKAVRNPPHAKAAAAEDAKRTHQRSGPNRSKSAPERT